MELPTCNVQSRRSSSDCRRPLIWGWLRFRCQLIADTYSVPSPCPMGHPLRRCSTSTNAKPYRTTAPAIFSQLCPWSSMVAIFEFQEYLKSSLQADSFNAKDVSGSLAQSALQQREEEHQKAQKIAVLQDFRKRHGSLKYIIQHLVRCTLIEIKYSSTKRYLVVSLTIILCYILNRNNCIPQRFDDSLFHFGRQRRNPGFWK